MTEVTPAATPAEPSDYALAVRAVDRNMNEMQALGARIGEVVAKWPANTAFNVSTKEGMKEADAARKEARDLRLRIKKLRDAATDISNDLKRSAWAVADPEIARLDAIEKNAKAQIEAEEQKEATRKAALQEKVQAILRMAEGCGTWSAAGVALRMQEVAALNITEDEYQDFTKQATDAVLEVHSILTQARQAALHREAEERVRAQQERELAELREKQARAERVRAKVATMRALPDQAQAMEAGEVKVLLENHRKAVPDALHFEDQLELAELLHAKVAQELHSIWTAKVAATLVEQPHAADDGAEVLVDSMAPLSEGLDGDAPLDDELETRLPITTVRIKVDDEDPFSRPVVAQPPTPPMRTVLTVPMPRPVRPDVRIVGQQGDKVLIEERIQTGPGTPYFAVDELPLPDAEPVDLLKAAQEFITTAEEICGWGDTDNIPVDLIQPFLDIKAAVESLSN